MTDDVEKGRQDARRHAVERLLEDETLTSRLTDEAAAVLLQWGAARAESSASIARLRLVMRCINEAAGAEPPAAQVERVRSLLRRLDASRGVAPDR
ncbi:MAG: hypothetical protein U9R72_12375 [Chloroflexota bacterium]|nr:hypothetical protein [Chloroflexota bacterium]